MIILLTNKLFSFSNKGCQKFVTISPVCVTQMIQYLDINSLIALDLAVIDPIQRQYLNNAAIIGCNEMFLRGKEYEDDEFVGQEFFNEQFLHLQMEYKMVKRPCWKYLIDERLRNAIKSEGVKTTPLRQYLHARDGPATQITLDFCIGPGLLTNNQACFNDNTSRKDNNDLLFSGKMMGELRNDITSVAIFKYTPKRKQQYMSIDFNDIQSMQRSFIKYDLKDWCKFGIGVMRPIDETYIRTQIDIRKPFDVRKMENIMLLANDPQYKRQFNHFPCHDMVFISHGELCCVNYDQLLIKKKIFTPTVKDMSEFGLLLDHDSGTLTYFSHGIRQNIKINRLKGDYTFFIQIGGYTPYAYADEDYDKSQDMWQWRRLGINARTFR